MICSLSCFYIIICSFSLFNASSSSLCLLTHPLAANYMGPRLPVSPNCPAPFLHSRFSFLQKHPAGAERHVPGGKPTRQNSLSAIPVGTHRGVSDGFRPIQGVAEGLSWRRLGKKDTKAQITGEGKKQRSSFLRWFEARFGKAMAR